jgi:hypothetical protein
MSTTEQETHVRINTTANIFDIDPLVYAALASVYGEHENAGIRWVEVRQQRGALNFFRPEGSEQ